MPQVSVLDVAPTVLHLMGQPVARDMDGQVMPAVKEAVAVTGREVAWVDTYPRRRPTGTTPAASDYDEEIVERLRALGYLDAADAVD
jgi:arylsulfatase A-like enzyme